MRRTRHVVLPVRSWQYIGLMVVSLACLTLGLVSRDREGKSGSLTGPELKHTAPHEVDACPNDYRMALRPQNVDNAATRRIDNERRIPERQTRDTRLVRGSLEDERLSRMRVSRSTTRRDMRTRADERRSVSLDRRHLEASRVHEARNRRSIETSRLSERRTRESIDRRTSEINTRRIQLGTQLSTTDRRERLSREINPENLRSRDRRSLSEQRDRRNTLERRDRSRSTEVRREIIRVEERRSLNKQTERRERIQDIRRDNRHRSNDRLNERTSAERREIRLVDTRNIRSEGGRINEADSTRRTVRVARAADLDRRLSRERRNSMTGRRLTRSDDRINHQKSDSARTNGYLMTGTEFPLVKSTIGNGSYEFLRQTFLLVLCTVYTASLVKRKTGFIGNVLPQINRLRVW